jgi:5-methylcytosine-specific restriction endonuclease McrA
MSQKICSSCKRTKAVGEFAANRSRSDGLGSYCRECMRDYARVNAERVKVNAQRWHDKAPEHARELTRMRAREARSSTTIDQVARDYMRVLEGDPCSYCGAPPGDEIDHITAISKGGDGTWGNLTAACHACNASKGADLLLESLLRWAASGCAFRSTYRRGCRCEPCVADHRAYQRDWMRSYRAGQRVAA